MDPLQSIKQVAGSGMHAQSARLKVISENIANANSTGSTPDADPYRRKTITFGEMIDRNSGASMVEVDRIDRDPSDFGQEYKPHHPAANAEGYVKMPNVNSLVEMTDMRQASRSYEANMSMMENGRRMTTQMLDLLKR